MVPIVSHPRKEIDYNWSSQIGKAWIHGNCLLVMVHEQSWEALQQRPSHLRSVQGASHCLGLCRKKL